VFGILVTKAAIDGISLSTMEGREASRSSILFSCIAGLSAHVARAYAVLRMCHSTTDVSIAVVFVGAELRSVISVQYIPDDFLYIFFVTQIPIYLDRIDSSNDRLVTTMVCCGVYCGVCCGVLYGILSGVHSGVLYRPCAARAHSWPILAAKRHDIRL
jgi:hypothetical protein